MEWWREREIKLENKMEKEREGVKWELEEEESRFSSFCLA